MQRRCRSWLAAGAIWRRCPIVLISTVEGQGNTQITPAIYSAIPSSDISLVLRRTGKRTRDPRTFGPTTVLFTPSLPNYFLRLENGRTHVGYFVTQARGQRTGNQRSDKEEAIVVAFHVALERVRHWGARRTGSGRGCRTEQSDSMKL